MRQNRLLSAKQRAKEAREKGRGICERCKYLDAEKACRLLKMNIKQGANFVRCPWSKI